MKIGNTEITFKSTTPTRDDLKNVYDVCNRIFRENELFYTSEQVRNLKKDKRNVFL